MEFTEKLANLIMIQYYLAMDLEIHDTDFSLKEVEIGQKALDENGGSEKALSEALDTYIKENDWTGYLGTFGSGNRERGFAVEGFFEACGRSLTYNELEESKKRMNEWEGRRPDLYNEPNDRMDPADEAKQDAILSILDDDYSIENAKNIADELISQGFDKWDWYDFIQSSKPYGFLPTDFREAVWKIMCEAQPPKGLNERALEIGDGKVYAVQDAFYTRKTHDATGERDILIKNGDRDPSLTNTEKDVAKKSIEVLKQMGKLGDISKEYNVDHGPDLTYIPVEDTVKVTPDNGSKPYKIKIPEALSFLKSYEYDILDEAVAVYTKSDECKKALQESFKTVETVSSADNKGFGYLENEVTIFKVK